MYHLIRFVRNILVNFFSNFSGVLINGLYAKNYTKYSCTQLFIFNFYDLGIKSWISLSQNYLHGIDNFVKHKEMFIVDGDPNYGFSDGNDRRFVIMLYKEYKGCRIYRGSKNIIVGYV